MYRDDDHTEVTRTTKKKKKTELMSRNSQMHLGVITLNRAEVHFGAVEAYVMSSITSCVYFHFFSDSVVTLYILL